MARHGGGGRHGPGRWTNVPGGRAGGQPAGFAKPGPWSLASHRPLTSNGEPRARRAGCLPHLLTLRMMARDAQEAPLPWVAVAEVTRATEAILAEVEAAVRAVTGAGPGT